MKMNTLCAAVAAGLLGIAGTSFAQTTTSGSATTTSPSVTTTTPSTSTAPGGRVVGGDSSGVLPSENCTHLTGAEKATCEERNARGRASTGGSNAPAAVGSGTQAPGSPVSAALPSERCESFTGFEKEKCEERNARGRTSAGSSAAPVVSGGAAAGSPTVSGALPSEHCESLTGFEKERCEERNARGRSSTTGTPSSGATTTPGGR